MVSYFLILGVVYVVALVAFWPPNGEQPNDALFSVVMLAPAAGALAAWLVAGAQVQWGRPDRWVLTGLLPAAAGLLGYQVASWMGWITEDTAILRDALVIAPVAIGASCISAIGEEIGWRGFLWPTLRQSWPFLRTSVVVFAVWWTYHVPVVLLGWYGTLSALPAFTVAIAGFSLFVGVITDRSRSLWPSTVAHGAWNGLVATSFAASEGGTGVPAFAGSQQLLGEFGWIAAISMVVLGAVATVWHLRHPDVTTSTPA